MRRLACLLEDLAAAVLVLALDHVMSRVEAREEAPGRDVINWGHPDSSDQEGKTE